MKINLKKMNKLIVLFSIVFATISCSNAQEKENFSEKTLAMQLKNTDNQEVVFKDVVNKFKGKTIVIEVWASWCGDCVKAMPKMKELQKQNPNLVYLFISMDKEYSKWIEGIKKHELIGEHIWANDLKMMKGEFGKSIDLDWIPRYMIIDKNQKIVLYRAIETDFDKINATLKELK